MCGRQKEMSAARNWRLSLIGGEVRRGHVAPLACRLRRYLRASMKEAWHLL